MQHYDLSNLSDIEFEELCNDLFSAENDILVERFKVGKDQGIDGRFTETNGKVGIIQSKHYIGSGKARLISDLKNNELPKIKHLNPDRYVVFTSLPLLVSDKNTIKNNMSPYISSTADVFGQEQIKSLLSKHKKILEKYNQLWIPSTAILDRFLHNDIYNASIELILDAEKIQNLL